MINVARTQLNRSVTLLLLIAFVAACHFHPADSSQWETDDLSKASCWKVERAIQQFKDFDRMVVKERDRVLYGTGSFCTIRVKTESKGKDACRLSVTSVCTSFPEAVLVQHVLDYLYSK